MPKLTNSTPSYRRHASGQAIVQFGNKRHYLGPHGSKTSRDEYDRLVAIWLANGRQIPGRQLPDVTVDEVAIAFWGFAQTYHLPASGHRGEIEHYRQSLRRLRELYGPTPAAEFGPLALKAVRERMIALGWCRGTVNAQVKRIQRVFKWAVAEQLVPGSVYQDLIAVAGLRAGKTIAPDHDPVEPADQRLVDGVIAVSPPTLADMIRLQQLTGMRPGELVAIRPCDIDRSDAKLWSYTLKQHKTQHRGHKRVIYFGEHCQAVIAPYLAREATAHLFSPADSMAWVREQRTAARTTPLGCGNRADTHAKSSPKRAAGTSYTTASYGKAIAHFAEVAFPPPGDLAKRRKETVDAWRARLTEDQHKELKAWRAAHHWHPHQIRHNFATDARAAHGLEVAQILLGHKSLTVTQIYAAKNVAAAKEVMQVQG